MSGPEAPARAPGPGEAALPADSVGQLLRGHARQTPDAPAVLFEDTAWTWADYLRQCQAWAAWMRSVRPADGRPWHVGLLLENTPAYLAALGGAALTGATVVGLNDTRRGAELRRDIDHTDVAAIVTQPEKLDLLEPLADDLNRDGIPLFTHTAFAHADSPLEVLGQRLDPFLAVPSRDAGDAVGAGEGWADGALAADDPPLTTTWCLVLTSGTSSAPKAVICSHRRMLTTGARMRILLGVTPEDRAYVSMPLFHSNSLMVGWMPAVVAGASVALARRFTASGWLPDVRRYGATWFNYTGKPLSYIVATPEQPDDADNPVRRAFGNEGSPEVQRRFAERFGVQVTDLFGPTEGGVGITASPDAPAGALGAAGDHLRVVDDDGRPRAVADLDEHGHLRNADDAVGEIVNTAGPGPFEGYYGDEDAYARATRNGWYWTGDLGYVDADGWLYFAGRTDDWIRVDGENLPAAPVERILTRHPDVVVCAVYGVPDASAGDQVMAALELHEDATFDPDGFATWLDEQPDLGPKWRPRYVRVAGDGLPRTATNKLLTRVLKRQRFRLDLHDDPVWVRDGASYRRWGSGDEDELRAAFEANGRDRFWGL